ncbi:unnamed protein product [Eruca vesicaria subsp. sativa]|uniref:Uncharacterized protein n=1 Tax=Eruca vesicaria subsp. sativa TaxID=29727 RepID=A0ABC8LKU7_ERUVS|nr:unnamed protein product [Eruca vesicaria subsp. sativa]
MVLLGFIILLRFLRKETVSPSSLLFFSKDLTEFLGSDSDQVRNSLKQIYKIVKSDVLNPSLTRFIQAITVGLLRGYRLDSGNDRSESGFTDPVMDKLFTKSGSGFASAIVGSFARNLVLVPYSSREFSDSKLLDEVCSDDGRKLIGDCVQRFVSTAFWFISTRRQKSMYLTISLPV